MYPFTLGANIGTTITSILAALVASTSDAMQVALAHFFFNIFGIIIWYPLPIMRRVPIRLAEGLGKATRWWKGFPLLYIAVAFFAIPLILLGISSLFTSGSKGLTVLGSILAIFCGLAVIKFLWWWVRQDGRYKTEACFKKRQKRKDVMTDIVKEWEPLKKDMEALKDHTGYVTPEEEDDKLEKDKLKKDLDSGATVPQDVTNDEDETSEEAEVSGDTRDIEVADSLKQSLGVGNSVASSMASYHA